MGRTPMLTLMFSIFFLLNFISVPSFSCPIYQNQALLQFKSTLTSIFKSRYSIKFVELDSWNSTSDCCSWDRVYCYGTGSVIVLDLRSVAAPPHDFEQVPISPDILTPLFHVRSLEELDISSNNFKGEIPSDGFGNLTNLVHLDMRVNSFNGSIPNQIFLLKNLDYLDMSWNYLQGILSPGIGKLQNLRELYLDMNSLSGNIPEEIGNLTYLRILLLHSNKFCNGIPSSFVNLSDLETLHLFSNNLTLEIPSLLQNMSMLSSLRLQENIFTQEIPTWLFEITTLTELNIGGKGKKCIWNNANKVNRTSSLQYFSIRYCGISGQIPQWISSQTELVNLDLSGNQLEGMFPNWLSGMDNIQSIVLSDNNFSGQFPRLPVSLQLLNLNRNVISGELPEDIGNAVNLKYLSLSENHISGLIPKSISKITGLSVLDLSRNRFSGDSLPVFTGEEYGLFLDLSDNDFSGRIPANFPAVTEILYLGGNKFCGSLPSNLSKLVNLTVLDLWNSIITGNLQDLFPQFPTSLEILVLRNTSLNGFIPNISMCTSLRILDLSMNNLIGSIPQEMANLPMMNMPALSNPISRPSPTERFIEEDQHQVFQKMLRSSLQDLIMNWKKYPQHLPNLHSYVLLDLSGNNISGQIPTSLGNLKALQQLNISHNKISGNIPSSLGNLVRIESLDVSHNELSGLIPQSLDLLGQLSVLDVSSNMLTGRIPRGGQMDTMNELTYFQNNSGLCGMQIKITCPEDPSLEGRVEEKEDLSLMFWEGTWFGFPIGFFSTILMMCYFLKFIQLVKIW